MTGAGRPPARWCHASTALDDFALITWATDPARVAALLPDGFVPEVRNDRAFVSMVPFLDDGFHFRAAPFARVSCGQVNYRAYVRRGDQSGVWFFGTSLDSVFVHLPRIAWKMPWYRTRLSVTSSWDDDACRSWRLEATGAWGGATIALRGTGRPLPVPDGFADADDAHRVLLDPFVGWYQRRDGSGIGRYSVWHEPLAPEEAVADEIRCDVLRTLDVIDDGQAPVSIGVQRRVHFDVHTPPVRD